MSLNDDIKALRAADLHEMGCGWAQGIDPCDCDHQEPLGRVLDAATGRSATWTKGDPPMVVVLGPDGWQVITEGVQVLYDALVHSMDWGSGFLDTDEINAIRALSKACDFDYHFYTGDPGGWNDLIQSEHPIDYDGTPVAEHRIQHIRREQERLAKVRVEQEQRAAEQLAHFTTHEFTNNVTWPCARCGRTQRDAQFEDCWPNHDKDTT